MRADVSQWPRITTPQSHVDVRRSFDRFVWGPFLPPIDQRSFDDDFGAPEIDRASRPFMPCDIGRIEPAWMLVHLGRASHNGMVGKSTCVLCWPRERSRLPWFLCRFKQDSNRWRMR